jgi:hypothetical protein
VASDLDSLAKMLGAQDRKLDAAPLPRRAHAIKSKLPGGKAHGLSIHVDPRLPVIARLIRDNTKVNDKALEATLSWIDTHALQRQLPARACGPVWPAPPALIRLS